jgi:ATP dependent DNA ligase domain
LFDVWRFHAFFTTVDADVMDTVTADKIHRGHAIIEQVHADLKNSALAHLPSGVFTANAAWLVLAVMAFNLTRAAATLAGHDDPDEAAAWFEVLPAMGVEGLVAKGKASRYEPGRRGWLKVNSVGAGCVGHGGTERVVPGQCSDAGVRSLPDRCRVRVDGVESPSPSGRPELRWLSARAQASEQLPGLPGGATTPAPPGRGAPELEG